MFIRDCPPRPPLPARTPAAALAGLRATLDALDDQLHDLLQRRAAVVGEVGRLKQGVALRPGREAAIIRRLLARHQGALPRATLVRVWRELLAGATGMQGEFVLAVCDPDSAGASYTQLAREHFGALTPLRVHRTPAQAIGELSAGSAGVAVLPPPSDDEPAASAWWLALLHRDAPRIHVIARLPFWAPRPEGAPRVQALVAAAIAPDPSGADRSLLGLEVSDAISRGRLTAALTAVGLSPGPIILRRDPTDPVAYALVDVAGHLTEADPRLPALRAALRAVQRPPVVLGAYAIPIEDEPT
jgi:chorismate mutase